MEKTHNLEVPGSSPGWSTLKIKHLQRFCRCFFFCLRTPCEHRIYLRTSHEHKETMRTRFWCSQNTQSLFFENYFRFSISFFSAESPLLGVKLHFGVRKSYYSVFNLTILVHHPFRYSLHLFSRNLKRHVRMLSL